jgi:hypothetical protein
MRFLFPACFARLIAGGRRVNYLQRVLVIGFGMLLAAALYFKLAMGNGRMFSHFTLGIAVYVGLFSIPASFVALNFGNRTFWTGSLGVLVAALMFVWLLGLSFVTGMPGTDFIDDGMLNSILILPAISAALLVVRFHKVLPTLGISLLCSFVACFVGVQFLMRHLLETQIASTMKQGGCVLVGDESKKSIQSSKQVDLGWVVGHDSDLVYFVQGAEYFKWSYGNFGLASRRGVPKSFPLTSDLNCNAETSSSSLPNRHPSEGWDPARLQARC